MPSHVPHHRRATRALFRRKADKVHVLDERFSPTATFAEMTEVQPPDTVIFPPVGHPHQHQKPTLTTPILPPLLTPDLPTTTTPVVPITPIPPPITPTTTPTITPTIISSSAPVVITSSAVPTTSSRVIPPTSSIPPDLDTVTTLITTRHASHISSAVATPSSTPSPSSGVNTGAVVGGVGAGIAAIAAIGFAVVFFVRRIRKRREDAIDFSPHDFRRSAILLSDPPTHEDTVARGYNPPPPPPPISPMMQQRQQPPVSASTTAYNEPYYGQGAAYGTYHQYQEQEQYPSQSAFSHSALSSVTSPHQGGVAAYPYGPNPFEPSPLPSPYEQAAIATSQPAGMTRQLTIDPHLPSPSLRSAQIPANDYVDLSRSSVSPFQAAQYAEISRRLKGLPESPVAEERSITSPAELYATQQKDLPTVPPEPHSAGPSVSDRETITQNRVDATSPPVSAANVVEYATPAPVPPPPVAVTAGSHSVSGSSAALPSPSFVTAATHVHGLSHDTLSVQASHLPTLSTDSFSQEPLEFPVPPSPALSYSSRYRVDSAPPTLPEITIQERSSVSSYIPKSPMIGTGYISGISEMSGTSGLNNMGLQSLPGSARLDGKFVSTKSPLASSMVVATPVEAHMGVFAAEQEKAFHDGSVTALSTARSAMIHQQAAAAPTPTAAASATGPKMEERRTTVYDPEDAYGGI